MSSLVIGNGGIGFENIKQSKNLIRRISREDFDTIILLNMFSEDVKTKKDFKNLFKLYPELYEFMKLDYVKVVSNSILSLFPEFSTTHFFNILDNKSIFVEESKLNIVDEEYFYELDSILGYNIYITNSNKRGTIYLPNGRMLLSTGICKEKDLQGYILETLKTYK